MIEDRRGNGRRERNEEVNRLGTLLLFLEIGVMQANFRRGL